MTNFGGFGPPGGQNAPPPTLQTCGSVVTRTKPAIYKKIIFKENVLIISSGALGLLAGDFNGTAYHRYLTHPQVLESLKVKPIKV